MKRRRYLLIKICFVLKILTQVRLAYYQNCVHKNLETGISIINKAYKEGGAKADQFEGKSRRSEQQWKHREGVRYTNDPYNYTTSTVPMADFRGGLEKSQALSGLIKISSSNLNSWKSCYSFDRIYLFDIQYSQFNYTITSVYSESTLAPTPRHSVDHQTKRSRSTISRNSRKQCN